MAKNCKDKMVFDTKKEAETAVVIVEMQRGLKLKVYRCTICELWHMSSSHS